MCRYVRFSGCRLTSMGRVCEFAESGSGPSQPRWIQGLLTGEHLPQIRPRLYSRSGRGAEIAQPAGFRAHPPFK